MNFIDALSDYRRRAMLTGQPMTNQEISGMGAGYFDAAANTNAANRALAISQKNAADQLAQERWTVEQQIEAAKKAQESQMYGNIAQTGMSTLGMNYLTSKPGESLISKGAGLVKDIAGSAINYGADLLGMGSQVPTFTEALTPSLIEATGTGGGVSLLPEAGGAIVPDAALTAEAGISGEVAAGGTELAVGTGAETAGSGILGTVGSYASTAAPWAALGYIGTQMIAPWVEDKLYGQGSSNTGAQFLRSVSNGMGFAPQQQWAEELYPDKPRVGDYVANILNPAGALFTGGNIMDKGRDMLNPNAMITDEYGDYAGAAANILNPVGGVIDAVGDILNGNVPGPSSDNTTNAAAAVLTGGLSLGTFVCTELYRQGYLTEDVFKADAKFGKKMDKVEYDWYKTWGVPLAIIMKKSKLISRIVKFFMKPVSLYMAAEMGVGNGSLFGKINFKVLQLVCKWRMK